MYVFSGCYPKKKTATIQADKYNRYGYSTMIRKDYGLKAYSLYVDIAIKKGV